MLITLSFQGTNILVLSRTADLFPCMEDHKLSSWQSYKQHLWQERWDGTRQSSDKLFHTFKTLNGNNRTEILNKHLSVFQISCTKSATHLCSYNPTFFRHVSLEQPTNLTRCISQHLRVPEIAPDFWVTPNPHSPHPGSVWAVSHSNTFMQNLIQINNWKSSSDGIWRQFHTLKSGSRTTALWISTYKGLKISHSQEGLKNFYSKSYYYTC